MTRPLVSVVIPTYNRAHTIRRSISSVLNQTWKHLEIIVVDDGSTDDTEDVLKEYGTSITYLKQTNAGPSAARNAGIKKATGKYIAFLDSDDIWFPTKTEKQVNLLEKSDDSVNCCICNIRLATQSKRESTSFGVAAIEHASLIEGIWTNPLPILLTRFVLFNQAVMVRRSILDTVGLFDPKLRLLEDYDLALRLSAAGNWGILMETLVEWTPDPSTSLTKAAKQIEVSKLSLQLLRRFRNSGIANEKYARLAESRSRILQREISILEFLISLKERHPILARMGNHAFETLDRARRKFMPLPKIATHSIFDHS